MNGACRRLNRDSKPVVVDEVKPNQEELGKKEKKKGIFSFFSKVG